MPFEVFSFWVGAGQGEVRVGWWVVSDFYRCSPAPPPGGAHGGRGGVRELPVRGARLLPDARAQPNVRRLVWSALLCSALLWSGLGTLRRDAMPVESSKFFCGEKAGMIKC